MGHEEEFDIVFATTDGVIVKQGDIVTTKDIETLERVAETRRNDIAENAHREIDSIKVDSSREAECLKVNYQGQIDSAQTQLETQRVDRKQRLEQLRRDLEGMQKTELLQENRYRELRDSLGPTVFRAGMGAEAVRELISALDMDKLATDMRKEIGSTVGQRRKKATKRLKVVEAFRKSNTSPEWMIMTVLPVLPPDLRPMVQLDGGRFATSDFNDLYRPVIKRHKPLNRPPYLGAAQV